MTDIVKRLRATEYDKDNFPRMKNERWLPVSLAKEAADEIERLRADNVMMANALAKKIGTEHLDEIERLREDLHNVKAELARVRGLL